LREKYDVKLPDYLNAKQAWEKARKEAIKDLTERGEIKTALDEVGRRSEELSLMWTPICVALAEPASDAAMGSSPLPIGGLRPVVGWHGSMKPAGRPARRCSMGLLVDRGGDLTLELGDLCLHPGDLATQIIRDLLDGHAALVEIDQTAWSGIRLPLPRGVGYELPGLDARQGVRLSRCEAGLYGAE
jgi:hypothetical protein